MANHAGNEGSVAVGANTVAEIRSWNVETSADTTEDSSMGDTWRTHKTTLRSWTGSTDCWWDETDTTGQEALLIGAEVTLNLYPEGDGLGNEYYTGTAIVSGITRSADMNGMVEASFTFQGVGELTQATGA